MPPLSNTLILASASPRRAQLLTSINIHFEVVVSPAEEPEKKPAVIPTDFWPACLAFIKATAVREKLKTQHTKHKTSIILAADTIVVHNDRIINKARNRAHARHILASLSGKTHQVITGICILSKNHVRLSRAVATCKFKKLSPTRLTNYLDSNLWQGKAGAYGIQDGHDPFVTLVSGELSTVMGLPLTLVQQELASFPQI